MSFLAQISGYCAHTERCKTEVAEKLKKLGANADEISATINKLEEENFINEGRYCRGFVHDKLRFSKWGRIKIVYALRMKRVNSADIQSALEQIEEEEYLIILRDLLRAKERTIRARDEYDKQAKLLRFAAGRGFEPELIKRALRMDE